MGREILLRGDTLSGKFLYEIESVSGTGASCIVYKARYYDDKKQSHLVQIKEFYPYNLEIYREKNSNKLICTDAEQFELEKCRFINNAKKMASFNNDEITNSGTPFQVEIFETNQTAYSVVAYDAGDIYSEENLQTMELAKLLEIIKNLARAVEFFHKNGYIHLDIKPENFLVDNTGHITLFDIDSVVSCGEINNETIQNISHTRKWAAPEVRQAAEKGKNTNVSYTADIYSIGLILFEAIMCRDFIYPVETLPYSRNWDIENSVKVREEKQNRKVNINPKFYHKIKEIFEKTLDRNPSKRCNSAQELYDNLDKARDLLKKNPWIIPSFRTLTPQFTGRKSELSKMNSILQKENTVFLHGFGGIGKSELALKYAEVYKDDFDIVVFCKYESNIREALLNIRIANYENDSNTMYLRKVAELCDERTLIILDNFDVETDADDYLDEFVNNYHCKKIITTRTNFSKLYTQLDVESLGQDDATLLFEKESKWIPKTEDEEKTLNEILKLIGYHTYFTVILAKKKEMFSLSIDELKKQSEEMLLKKSGRVTVAKDGKLTTATVDAIAAKLFDFESISKSERQSLRNLYMLRWRTISRNDYAEIAGFGMSDDEKVELMDSLNDLTRLGWVLHNEKTDDFSLHPIMQELVKNKLGVNTEKLTNLLDYYEDLMSIFFDDSEIKKKFVQGGKPASVVWYSYYYHLKELIALCDVLLNADNECSVNKNSAYITNNLLKFISFENNHIRGSAPNAPIITKLMAKLLKSVCPGMHKKEYYKLLSKQIVFSLAFGDVVYAKDIKGNEIYEFNDIISAKNFDYNNIVHLTFSEMSLNKYVRLCLSYYNDIRENFDEDSDYIDIFLSAVYPYLHLIEFNLDDRINKEHFLNSDIQKLWDILRNDLNDEHILRCEKTANKYLNENKSNEREVYAGYSEEFFKYLKIIHNEDVNLYELLENIEKAQTLTRSEKSSLKTNLRLICTQNVEKNAGLIVELLEYSCFDCISVEDKSDEYNDWIEEAYLLLAYSYVDEEKCSAYAKKIFSIVDSIPYKDDFNYLSEINRIMNKLYYVFSKENKFDKMFDLICNYVTDRIDFFEKKQRNTFDLYQWLSKLTDQLYIETNDEKYRELSNNYKSKIKELSDINYEIKD